MTVPEERINCHVSDEAPRKHYYTRKCPAPGCTSNDIDPNITFHRFPKTEERLTQWLAAFPNIPWKYCKSARLCEKHFSPDSYDPSKVKTLRDDAVPTIWPNVPLEKLRTSANVVRSTQLSSASSRRESSELLDGLRNIEQITEAVFKLPEKCMRIVDDQSVVFLKISTGEKPSVQYSFKIFRDLSFEIWFKDEKLLLKNVLEIDEEPDKLILFSSIMKVINALEAANEKPAEPETVMTKEEIVEDIVEKLQELFPGDRKALFLCEQLTLMLKKPHARRYSPGLLSYACMWHNTSPALYRILREILTLPVEKYVQRLASAITVDYELSDGTIAYLKARMEKLCDS